MTKLLIFLSIFFIFTACSEFDNLSGNKVGGDNVTVPSNPDTPTTPPTDPDNPTNPDTPVTPPTDPDNPTNPDTPVMPPTDPDKPVDKRPICPTIISNAELTAIAKKYPGYSIGVGKFVAFDERDKYPLPEVLTDRSKAEYLQITPEDRTRILRTYAVMRFVVNTKEFEDEFMKSEYNYPSGVTLDCSNTSNCTGKISEHENLDKTKYLQTIRKLCFNVGMRKKMISGAHGMAILGQFLYLHNNDSWAWDCERDLPIHLSSWQSWSEPNLKGEYNSYADDIFLAELLFHESLHLAGFSHYEPYGQINRKDAVYTAEDVFSKTYNDEFRVKYSKELDELKRYYEESYANYINYETFVYPNDSCRPAEPTNKNRLISVSKEQREYEENVTLIKCDIYERYRNLER